MPFAARRYLALWFPFLPTDRLVMEARSNGAKWADGPLVFVEKVGGALQLAHCNPDATQLGLTPSLALADARARIPGIAVRDSDPEADGRLLQRLAERCDRFTPLVMRDDPHGLMFDITGCAHLFGGEEQLQAAVVSMTDRIGLMCRTAIADTPDGARAFVRFGGGGIIPVGGNLQAAQSLPVAALEAPPDVQSDLRRAGLKRLGDLFRRSSNLLASRFGMDLVTKLQRIKGEEDRRISPLRAPPACRSDRQFAEPLLQVEALTEVLRLLIEDVSQILEARGEGGRRFEASFFRTDGEVRRLSIETGSPSRSPQLLIRLFRERLDTLADPIDPGFGFDAARLSVLRSEPLLLVQPGLERNAEDGESLSGLVDRLTIRFGRENVLRFRRENTHAPQRAVSVFPAQDGVQKSTEQGGLIDSQLSRPLKFFEPAERLDLVIADTPDGIPRAFKWRRLHYKVRCAEGPERISPEWWRADAASATHDYYRVEDEDGRRFWIFRAGLWNRETAEAEWYLRGLFA
ncbi:MAG: DNA polymerase Y family protein [Alphaproteobacteria bacterium]|nr:DNA polymerase Y family protein [Alphaproteobacteria bacterium]